MVQLLFFLWMAKHQFNFKYYLLFKLIFKYLVNETPFIISIMLELIKLQGSFPINFMKMHSVDFQIMEKVSKLTFDVISLFLFSAHFFQLFFKTKENTF